MGIAPARSLPLARVTDLRLPGSPSRFDYESIDPIGRRLYLAHLGDSTLVVDLDAPQVVATVPDLASVHGVALASDLGRVYATATGADQLVGIDVTTNRIVSRTATGNFPDGVVYDADKHRLFVSDKNDGALSVGGGSGQADRPGQGPTTSARSLVDAEPEKRASQRAR